MADQVSCSWPIACSSENARPVGCDGQLAQRHATVSLLTVLFSAPHVVKVMCCTSIAAAVA
jgi:hypothetical protein